MSVTEVEAILEGTYEQYKERWELARFSAYIRALTAGSKIKSPKELIKFEWDEKDEEKVITKEEVEEARKTMLQWAEAIKKGK
jgi:hypothetical protein